MHISEIILNYLMGSLNSSPRKHINFDNQNEDDGARSSQEYILDGYSSSSQLIVKYSDVFSLPRKNSHIYKKDNTNIEEFVPATEQSSCIK